MPPSPALAPNRWVLDWARAAEELQALIDAAKRGDRPIGLNVSLPNPALIEIAGAFGFEWILIDQEHTEIQTLERLLPMIRAAQTIGRPCFVKLDGWNAQNARAALDLGAYGVLVPFVETAEELRAMLAAVRFPPRGNRGFCSVMRATAYGSATFTQTEGLIEAYTRFGNEQALVIPTIESAKAVDNLEALLEVEECPIWHIGLEDLALSLSKGSQPDWDLAMKLYPSIAKEIHDSGKLLTAFFSPSDGRREEVARAWEEIGNDLPYAGDAECLAFGFQEAMQIGEVGRRPIKRKR